jgi:FkbM family methyltransferase
MSFSQAGQDRWVIEILLNKSNGYFLDIGAYDGVHFSNSLLLEQNFNWSGLLVEANPTNFQLLTMNRPKSNNVMCAISDTSGRAIINNLQMSSKILENINFSQRSTEIEQITFKELFKKYEVPNTIDYMSLDIEGHESKALSQFPFESHICKTLTIEHNLYIEGPENKKKIQNILLHNNYILIKENVSCDNHPFEDWYIHQSIYKP